MDIRRIVLFSALFFVGYTLLNTWRTEHPSLTPPALVKGQLETILPPSSSDASPVSPLTETVENHQNTSVIEVKTDVLRVKIDLENGRVVEAQLLDYPEKSTEENVPFSLLDQDAPTRYVANSELYMMEQQQVRPMNLRFTTQQKYYEMSPSQSQLVVELIGRDDHGIAVKKTFTFDKGSYLIHVDHILENEGETTWSGYLNTQLSRAESLEKSSPFQAGSYTGASYSSPGIHRYQKVTFKDISKSNLDAMATGGWIAMQQRYFLTAWIPDTEAKSRFYTRVTPRGDYVIGAVSASVTLSPKSSQTLRTRLYAGPEVAETLSKIAPGLNLTIDYGWLWFISSLLFSLMKFIHQYVGNWGWSIVIVTILIKLAFYRLSATSYRSMAAMRKLQPKMQALRERYGDDKAKMSQATMELYRKEKVNPLAGCLPLIVQIPVMIGLYWVLAEGIEFRLSPFIFWITDLASPDPWHVLPVLMGITMWIQQKLNPAPPDPMQAKMMMFLPVLLTGLFWNFPSGLVLYWTVNNALTILQQWHITRKYNDDKPKKALARA